MNWPPAMSWTCKQSYKGEKHFVAFDYGSDSQGKWVDMVSVLDGEIYLRVSYEELNDFSIWSQGWIEEDKRTDFEKKTTIEFHNLPRLLPSIDSGLTIPLQEVPFRPWLD